MKRASSKPDPWGQIDAMRRANGWEWDDVPPHAFTAQDYARRYGLSFTRAAEQLRALVEQGAICSGKKLVNRGNGRRVVRFFWLP